MIRSILLFTAVLALSAAGETKAKRIEFKPGESHTVVSGEVSGRDSVLYKLNARDKQWLKVLILPVGKGADFNIYIPGRGPGEEALFNSLSGGREYVGQLYKSGDHSIDVFLNRAAARRGETAGYKMLVSITDEKPPEEEKPATGPVPDKVINDCLAALRKQIPDREMKVIKAERGETSFIIDVDVEGVEKPWRCYHDGTQCTGTEYQGEG
ncbi:hypothetical protein [Haloferula sp. A504]|uniref:hypothetical protein n=1 Tax=Haloferula sp. A504 TaxID=3373601 RepID=UPI0031C0A2AE|nr:hypothetical protein [Verrucomicrobiaceae bacterium E54]